MVVMTVKVVGVPAIGVMLVLILVLELMQLLMVIVVKLLLLVLMQVVMLAVEVVNTNKNRNNHNNNTSTTTTTTATTLPPTTPMATIPTRQQRKTAKAEILRPDPILRVLDTKIYQKTRLHNLNFLCSSYDVAFFLTYPECGESDHALDGSNGGGGGGWWS